MKKRLLVIMLGVFFVLKIPLWGKDIYLKSYLNGSEKDVTPAVYKMLQDAKNYKNVKIIIEEGEYHFYPEKAFAKYCYVCNNDNGMRKIAFPLIGFKDLTIEGKNTHFIFHGIIMPFDIENARNIKISGISIDWHIPLHSEALVVANNESEGTFDIQISNDYPYVIRNKQLFFIKEGYEHDLGNAILFDPQRKSVAYNTLAYTPLDIIRKKAIRNKEQLDFQNYVDFKSPDYVYQDAEWGLKEEEIKPGLVRITTTKKLPPVGMVLICKGRNGNNRIASAFHISQSKNIELNDINIYHAGGMGVIAERSEDIFLNDVKVLTNPKSGRMVSTTADATHFVNCKGIVKLNNCVFKNMLDDGTNVHGAYVIVDNVISPNTIGVRVGHYQQAGFIFAEKGDKIGFIDQTKSLIPNFTATVKSVNYINDRYYTISFNENIIDKIRSNFVLENLDWYPEVSITNCTIADNRARGILLSTPKKTIVENNFFSNMMSAIRISPELKWWYESGRVQDVIIQNNRFGDCCYGGGRQPVIFIHAELSNGEYVFGKIVINQNEFHQFDSAILAADCVKDLEFTKNVIKDSKTFPPLYPEEPVLKFNDIGKLKIDSIQYEGDLEKRVFLKNIGWEEIFLKN
jgi:hypothetical protein